MAKRSLKRAASNTKNLYILAGIVAVVVISGIMLTSPGVFNMPASQTQEQDDAGAQETVQQETEPVTVSEPTIGLTNFPETAYVNVPFTVIWKIDNDGQAEIPHTAVHYGQVPVAEPKAATDYPSAGKYFEGTVPGSFNDAITIASSGMYYFRVHAIVDGKDVWTEEHKITVVNPSTSTTVREIYVKADDSGFYDKNDNPMTEIRAKLGEKLRITFKTLTSNVYYSGLRYESEDFGFDTGKVSPGKEGEAEFTVGDRGEIKSFWPSSDTLKATLSVVLY